SALRASTDAYGTGILADAGMLSESRILGQNVRLVQLVQCPPSTIMWQTYNYEKRTPAGITYWLVTREITLGKWHPKGGASVLTHYDELKCVTSERRPDKI
ncbi:hypothetical protein, partial [uncultured Porphyromonas sp.]|uniref:hypothetical protein n=1 Tax=uncultured Porphyromonas sp. TaxID=159274 RepID=UPI0025988DA9